MATPQIELKGKCLTLSTDYDESYLRNGPVHSELVVDSVNFLEAGLIFQTEDQDDCIHPTCKLERREEKNKSIKPRALKYPRDKLHQVQNELSKVKPT